METESNVMEVEVAKGGLMVSLKQTSDTEEDSRQTYNGHRRLKEMQNRNFKTDHVKERET